MTSNIVPSATTVAAALAASKLGLRCQVTDQVTPFMLWFHDKCGMTATTVTVERVKSAAVAASRTANLLCFSEPLVTVAAAGDGDGTAAVWVRLRCSVSNTSTVITASHVTSLLADVPGGIKCSVC